MNVLVYSGRGTTPESVKHTVESLRLHLSPNYAVVTVSEQSLLGDPWQYKTSVLVIPGGADLPYCDALNGDGNSKITQFVRKGGRYLGLCAGGYYGAKRCEFEEGDPIMEVSGPRELAFFPGIARGCVYKGFDYESHAGSKAVTMAVNTDALPSSPGNVDVYYNGGGLFVDASKQRNVEVLARYAAPQTDLQDEDLAAGVYCKVGKGCAVLFGTHPEFSPALMKGDASDQHFASVRAQIESNDYERKRFLRACLSKMGLKVNDDVEGSIPRLTPIYLSSSLDPSNARGLLSTLQENLDFVAPRTFEDINDTFVLHDEKDSDITEDSEMDGEQSFDQVLSAPKHIKFFTSDAFPSHTETPYFNMEKYFAQLKRLHEANNESIGSIGSLLAYGEVVTSTNTLLDKNPNWLEHLPHGLTFTATTQIAGRGRGGNVWINPKGVMATSILFKLPKGESNSSIIVTLQYLCALALIESILGYGSLVQGQGSGYEDLPLKLKWPNDMYALKPEFYKNISDKDDVSNTVEGDDEKWAKISGSLINSQFLNGQFHLVWGGGVNVSNEAPTTSLNRVLAKLNELRAAKGLPELPPFEHETLLAKLVFNMEQFYNVFQRSGLQPFLSLYYKRWFHSNQHVRLDAEGNGNVKDCIIRGITSDYGLLVAEDSNTHEKMELQPDGNSFDIFKGLVYKKR
ncbi:hypothetical protein FT663_01900 [Candidozyma haemuli var. vulneris]|uniref:BPL/LPL catalytic domain-containing protein n=1 Tax=Candidozyma haemuli TaxID=45357 RepID=A0A2V1AT61_9ASCO|nr:hypothetical protein CXQ85_004536 [[Candida] haemuloni]KAF3990867.1 hypothetical protein FT662_02029 [[Candida] haemuloni var. vulneris]KAF3993396.1 hypothetical protein FT663_01900 [[Candida] haemuloni var. vulneris]PVH21018.1 hypothetical protein CXQ85_004536 [[Candida] haemuloni]